MAANKTATEVATPEVVEQPEVARTKRVIIQRPADNKDLGVFLGFNNTSNYYPFDAPITLPADMVDFWRSQKIASFYPGEDGKPVTTYTAQFNIIDAPL